MGEIAFFFVIPLVSSIGFGLVTRALVKRRRGWAATGIVFVCIIGALFCYWQSLRPSSGPSDYAGIGWGIVTLIFAIPASVGGLIGLVIGAFAPEQA